MAGSQKDDRLGFALVGLGRAGHFHLESLRRSDRTARLLWAVDLDVAKAERIAGEHPGCRWAAALDAAAADPEVDAIIVASATDTHFPLIMQSLRAHKAVFAEKPISHEIPEVEEAVAFALAEDLPLVCGYQRRADANFRELKRQLDAGAIGQLKVVKSCSRDNPLPPMEYLRTSGGIFHDMLVHDFDMLDFISDGQAPESVTSVGHCYHPEIREMGDIDTCAVMFKYPSGLLAMVDTSRDAAYGYDQRIEAFGERGMVSAKNELTSTVELATSDGHLTPPAAWSFPQRYAKAYATELAEFLRLLRAGPGSAAHLAEQEATRRHPHIIRTTVAAELSWRLGRTVRIDEVDALAAAGSVDALAAAGPALKDVDLGGASRGGESASVTGSTLSEDISDTEASQADWQKAGTSEEDVLAGKAPAGMGVWQPVLCAGGTW